MTDEATMEGPSEETGNPSESATTLLDGGPEEGTDEGTEEVKETEEVVDIDSEESVDEEHETSIDKIVRLKKFVDEDGEPDYEKIAETYLLLEKKLGNGAALPPKDVEGYDYEFSVPVDEEMSNTFKAEALKHGISADAYKWLMGEWENAVGLIQNNGNTLENATSALQEQWGNDFSANVESANRAISTYIPDGVDLREYPELGNHPLFAQIMANIGRELSEDSTDAVPSGRHGYTQSQIDEMMMSEDYGWNEDKQKIVDAFYARAK